MARLYDAQGNLMIWEANAEALTSINVEYGRHEGASYYLVRIPQYTTGGKKITPKVAMTSADGSLEGNKVSALEFAKREHAIFTINGGVFNINTTYLHPHGQTIVDGVSVTNELNPDSFSSPISNAECYPLCIDADGNLSSPYAQGVDTADMIADGVVHAVTGWGQLIDNYSATDESKYNEIVHADKLIPCQVIGQYQNGDYCVLTVDGVRGSVQNESGLTDKQARDLLIAKGVKFAYLLDGGGSTETVIGNRQINPIYTGNSGRAIPTVIYFDTNE